MEIVTLLKSCGGKSGRLPLSRSNNLTAEWKDDGKVTATVTHRSGSSVVNPDREEGVGGK